MTESLASEKARVAKLYGLRLSHRGGVAEPPKLRDLIRRALELGYEEPDIDFGDGNQEIRDARGVLIKTVRVPMVQVQLHSNEHGKRNVVGNCQILQRPDGDVKKAMLLATRSALAEALLLVETQG